MAEANSSLAERAAAWAFELVAIPSVTGTADEAAFAEHLRVRLAALPIFADDPQNVWTIPAPGDPLGRASVAALVRGASARTIVLTGHFDTVHLEDFGDLAPLATQPYPLREALLARLAESASTPAELRAFADLESGAFLPGRGLLDMKAGLAAGLAALEAFAAGRDRPGNLLFLAVPDEEANSAGALCAAAALPDIARRFGLSLEAAINLDSLIDDGDGTSARAIALGTIGKLLPSALVIGQGVHASNALRGLNAGLLAAEIVTAVEWAPALTDRTGDELAAPPTLLGLKDNRVGYDVTTPDRVWIYWNVMTHRRGPEAVLAGLAAICRESAERAVERLGQRAAAIGGEAVLPADVPVLTFHELRAEVFAADGQAAERYAPLARASAGLDMPEQCRLLTEHLWEASRRSGPAIVIGFASLPYLPTALEGVAGARLERAARAAAAAISASHGVPIGICRYFAGISDMSHLGQVDPASLPVVAANHPAWGFGIGMVEETEAVAMPMINAGPWGRDYHTKLERLHAAYAFEVLPELLLELVNEIFTPA